jgi:hypothetical protein
MFSRPICRTGGLAPNKKRKARNMSSPTELMRREPSLAISVTCTSMRPTRRSLAGVGGWTSVVQSTLAGVLFLSAVGMCGR